MRSHVRFKRANTLKAIFKKCENGDTSSSGERHQARTNQSNNNVSWDKQRKIPQASKRKIRKAIGKLSDMDIDSVELKEEAKKEVIILLCPLLSAILSLGFTQNPRFLGQGRWLRGASDPLCSRGQISGAINSRRAKGFCKKTLHY